jgi:hypothetical protein
MRNFPSYASRTEGVAFIEDNVVSFRSQNPPERVVVHEIGHCYFKEVDKIWSADYGGGELLFWLIIQKDLQLDERAIFLYHKWLRRILEGQVEEVEKEIVKRLSKLHLPVYPHIYTYQLYSGSLGMGMEDVPPELLFDLENPRWQEVKVSRNEFLAFLSNILVGAMYSDSFCVAYVKALFE